jgi:rhomboid family GlyGly-CTERM serine protease
MSGLITNSERHGGFVPPWRSLVLVGLGLMLYLMLGPAPELLVYQRDAIAAGEWWRLLTGHWVHGDAEHLLWDLAGLGVLGLLFERERIWLLLFSLLASSLAIDLWLWWRMPWMETYCGLSGLLNGLLGCGLLIQWWRSRDNILLIIGLLAVAKILIELVGSHALFTSTLWPAVPEAHAVGLVAGLCIGVTELIFRPLVLEIQQQGQ